MAIPRESNVKKLDMNPPVLSSFTPNRGTPGTRVIISCSNCGGWQEGNYVTIGAIHANIESWSNNQIIILVPDNAKSGDIYITNANGDSNGDYFTVPEYAEPKHKILYFYPTSAYPGTQITICGTNFSNDMGLALIADGISLPVSYWSDTKIIAILPDTASTGNISVHGEGWSARGDILTVLEQNSDVEDGSLKPAIISVYPEVPIVGDTVTLTGVNFLSSELDVKIGEASQDNISSDSSMTNITFNIASGTEAGELIVTNTLGTSDGVQMMILPGKPIIDFISDESGNPIDSAEVNSVIVIHGQNFGPAASGNKVFLDKSGYSYISGDDILSWNDTDIKMRLANTKDYSAEMVAVYSYTHTSNFCSLFTIGKTLATTAYKSDGDNVSSFGQLQHGTTGLPALLGAPVNSDFVPNLNTQYVDSKSISDIESSIESYLSGDNDSQITIARVSRDNLGNVKLSGQGGIDVITDSASNTILLYKKSKDLLYLDPEKITSFCDLYGNCRFSKASTVPKDRVQTVTVGPGLRAQLFKKDGNIFINGQNLDEQVVVLSIDWNAVSRGNHTHCESIPTGTFASEEGDEAFLTDADLDSEVFNL